MENSSMSCDDMFNTDGDSARFERIWALSSYRCILTDVGKWTVILSIACMSLVI